MSINCASMKKNPKGHGVQISLNLLKYNGMTLCNCQKKTCLIKDFLHELNAQLQKTKAAPSEATHFYMLNYQYFL